MTSHQFPDLPSDLGYGFADSGDMSPGSPRSPREETPMPVDHHDAGRGGHPDGHHNGHHDGHHDGHHAYYSHQNQYYYDASSYAHQYFPIRVSDGENIAKIAGKLAWKVRRNEELTPLSAKGPGAIATAMGVISKAREFLANDNKDLVLVPSVLEQDPDDQGLHYRDHATIVFTLFPTSLRHSMGRHLESLVVTSRSKAAKVAGAVAGRVRASVEGEGAGAGEDGAVWLECSGDEAAMIMMLSLVKGRAYLRADSNGAGGHVSYQVVVALEPVRGERGSGKWRWIAKCVLV